MNIMKAVSIAIAFLSLCLLASCASEERAESPVSEVDSLEMQAAYSTGESGTETAEAEEVDCVFDTSSHRFTTEALIAYDSSMKWIWDEANRQALVPMPGSDTLILSIGGCTHFGYSADWHTAIHQARDTAFIIQKAQWMARHFFGGNDFKNYDSLIANNLYKRDTGAMNGIHYDVIYDGGDIQNIYLGFGAREESGRGVIWISGYIN